MRFEPGTRVIDDPALADRVTGVRMAPQSYDTAEDLATQKRMAAQVDPMGGKAASPAQPAAKPRTAEKSGGRESRESSHSASGARQDPSSQKRQWKAQSSSSQAAREEPV